MKEADSGTAFAQKFMFLPAKKGNAVLAYSCTNSDIPGQKSTLVLFLKQEEFLNKSGVVDTIINGARLSLTGFAVPHDEADNGTMIALIYPDFPFAPADKGKKRALIIELAFKIKDQIAEFNLPASTAETLRALSRDNKCSAENKLPKNYFSPYKYAIPPIANFVDDNNTTLQQDLDNIIGGCVARN